MIWSGLGMLVVVFAVLGAGGGAALTDSTGGLGLGLSEEAGFALGLGAAAAVNWLVGVALNRRAGRDLVDPATGEHIILRRRHRLFWVPMQYWSIAMAVFAVLAITSSHAPRGPVPSVMQRPD